MDALLLLVNTVIDRNGSPARSRTGAMEQKWLLPEEITLLPVDTTVELFSFPLLPPPPNAILKKNPTAKCISLARTKVRT